MRFPFIPLSVHPLFWCTMCYCLGIVIADLIPFWWQLVLLTSLFSLCTLLLYFKKMFFRFATLCIVGIGISFFTGILRYNHIQKQHKKRSIELIDQFNHLPFDCHATVLDVLQLPRKSFKHTLILTVTSLANRNQLPINATVQLHTLSPSGLTVGDRIKLFSLKLKINNNPAYERYLLKEGIDASAFLPHLRYLLLERPEKSLLRFLKNQHTRIIRALKEKLSYTSYALFCPLFLGLKLGNVSCTFKKHCVFWGIAHYLARSGLHVVLILAAWQFILRFFPFHFFVKQFFLLVLLLLYQVLTSTSISFSRALITFILYKVCLFRGLSYKTLHVVTLTTLMILLYNPLQIFFIDFQLSFALTIALAWFNEVYIKIQRLYNIVENN